MLYGLPVVMLVCSLLLAPAQAQFSPQGPKLVGTDAVGGASQGFSVPLSGDGNDWFLPQEQVFQTRERVNNEAASRRMLAHFTFTAGWSGWLDQAVERFKPNYGVTKVYGDFGELFAWLFAWTVIAGVAIFLALVIFVKHADEPSGPGSIARSNLSPMDRGSMLLIVLWAAVGALVLHASYYLWVGLFAPILDVQPFRQAQTAISAYWALHDGLKLAYETPVLGYPWSIPFEFPLYQWLVAVLGYFGMPIDVAGRLWSFAFLVACIWPLQMLFKALDLPRYVLPMTGILLFSSPIYIYWGRTVMIESCALFFGLLWLALLVRFLTRRSVIGLIGIVVAGSLGVLVKATTFPAFTLLGGFWILANLRTCLRRRAYGALFQMFVYAALACALPLAIGYAWVVYSDNVKLLNPFGALITSAALIDWNFGTWDQRFSARLLGTVFRAMVDIFGYSSIIAVIACAAVLVTRQTVYVVYAVAAGIGFLMPFLVFTNLHISHNYYQNANAIFALVAVGMALASFVQGTRPVVALVLLAAISAGQLVFFHSRYASLIQADFTKDDAYRIALQAKREVSPDKGLLVLGKDWSSIVHYYSERKGLSIMVFVPKSLMQRVFDDPNPFFGDRPVSGIVYCFDSSPYDEENTSLVETYLAGRKVLGVAGKCKLLSAIR
jgi:hypothetical protein